MCMTFSPDITKVTTLLSALYFSRFSKFTSIVGGNFAHHYTQFYVEKCLILYLEVWNNNVVTLRHLCQWNFVVY